ncbi:MFS transporter [Luethyella okanaganae]|uniref:MFS transporter n=1 Tax=Luethyella okanaganae TaxID=69372 RepID=A0ABW1VEM6_9MICO
MTNAAVRPARSVRSTARTWWRPAVALTAIGWGANQFAPLIVLYQRDGVASSATGLMFALYAVGLIPALLVGGRWSDRAGRRGVVQAALSVSIVATAALMLGSVQTWFLYPGRLLAGVSSGLAFGAGAAWIRELSASHGLAQTGPRRSTVAMTVGFGGGPLVAGLIAQWAAQPAITAYLPQLIVTVCALIAVHSAPDERARVDQRLPAPQATSRPLSRYLMVVMLPFAPWVFGTATIALAYLPAQVADSAGGAGLMFAAVTTALPAFAGVLIQPLAARLAVLGSRRLLLSSMTGVVVSLAIAAWAAAAASLLAVLFASLVLGAAYGLAQFTGLTEVQRVADPARLGTATAIYQSFSYLGFALPMALTLAQSALGWQPAQALLLVLAVAAGSTAWLLGATSTRTKNPEPRGHRGTLGDGSEQPC